MAAHAVRYLAPAVGQPRGPGGGTETPGQPAPAELHAKPEHLRAGARALAPPDLLNHGAACPAVARSRQPSAATQASPNGHGPWPCEAMRAQPKVEAPT